MFPMKDLNNALQLNKANSASVKTAAENGASVDMLGFESVMFVAVVGASGDTLSGSLHIQLELEESEDNTTFTDVADTDVRESVTGANPGTFAKIDDPAEDDAVYSCQYTGTKRYVRPVINLAGVHTNGTPISIVAIRAGKTVSP